MMMRFVVSIGDIMAGSDISECFGNVYGTVATGHILAGKAIARALRSHFLLESVLTTELVSLFFTT